MLRYKMDYYLFTFRPQITEQDLFEHFLTILKPSLKDSKTLQSYAYSVEEDYSLKKHIHLIAGFKKTKSKNNPLTQFFNGKTFKEYKTMLKTKQTNEPVGFDDRKVNDSEEDFLKVLGYVVKQPVCVRREYTFPDDKIQEAYTYYYTTDHIDKSNNIDNDWKVLTTKNAHVLIEKYIKDNDITEIRPQLKIDMIKDKFSFINFSEQKQQQLFNELDIHLFNNQTAITYEETYEDAKAKFDKMSATIADLQYRCQQQREQLKQLGAL